MYMLFVMYPTKVQKTAVLLGKLPILRTCFWQKMHILVV